MEFAYTDLIYAKNTGAALLWEYVVVKVPICTHTVIHNYVYREKFILEV